TSSNSPRRSEREVTVTSSGLSTTPRTRCSRASASIGLVGALLGRRLGGGLGGSLVGCRCVLRGLRGGLLLGGLGLALLSLVLGRLDRGLGGLGLGLGRTLLGAQGALGAE